MEKAKGEYTVETFTYWENDFCIEVMIRRIEPYGILTYSLMSSNKDEVSCFNKSPKAFARFLEEHFSLSVPINSYERFNRLYEHII